MRDVPKCPSITFYLSDIYRISLSYKLESDVLLLIQGIEILLSPP